MPKTGRFAGKGGPQLVEAYKAYRRAAGLEAQVAADNRQMIFTASRRNLLESQYGSRQANACLMYHLQGR